MAKLTVFEQDTITLMKHLKRYSKKYRNTPDGYITAYVLDENVGIGNSPSEENHIDAHSARFPYKEALNG
jgi:ribosomal protein S17E